LGLKIGHLSSRIIFGCFLSLPRNHPGISDRSHQYYEFRHPQQQPRVHKQETQQVQDQQTSNNQASNKEALSVSPPARHTTDLPLSALVQV